MEYRTLENTDSVCIYEAFTQAFSDYQVSVGAFADRTLVGFVLNGVRDWDNEKTIYDLGTGVIPDFRRTGIMGELLNLVSAICIKNKISVYQLEVIQDNEKALTLYKKQGFRINRRLNCYQLTGKIKGDIAQLAVHPQYRRMGVATEILLDLLKQTKSLEMRVINVDERDQALNAFLKKLKFSVFVKQYEMRKHFSA